MTKSNFKRSTLVKIRQGIAGLLTAVFFFTNVAGLHAAESNFWSDRRRAAQQSRGLESGTSPIQLASAGDFASRFPQANPVAFGGVAPTAGGGLDGSASLSVSSLPRPAGLTHDQDWLVQAVAPYGTIQDAHFSSAKSPLIVHIQDAHGVLDAQRNTASIILGLQKARGIQLVGLEGAAGGFETDAFRSINEAPITRQIAEDMLVEGTLGGAEYAGMVAEKAPLLWGVENLSDYHANIEAYKVAAKEAATFKYRVAAFSKAVDALKPTYYSPALREFDRYQSAYREKGEGLASYVSYLLGTPAGIKANVPQLRRLKEALVAEATLDFKEVESERRRLVEALAKHMSATELESLVRQSVLFRGGQLSHTAFHKSLLAAARANAIRVDSFPQFNAYIRYVESAELIRQADLFDELTGLESHAQSDLAKGKDEKRLMAASRSVLLLEKLASQSMSPSDWAEYLDRRSTLLTLTETLRDLAKGSAVPPTWPDMETALKPFEDFCRYATARNQGLTQNLLEKMKDSHSASAILVAGGFHTDGLVKMFKAKDLSYVVVTPKIQEIPKENHYLEAFTRDARPLEKILTGERIFLVTELETANSSSESTRRTAEADLINRSAIVEILGANGSSASDIIQKLDRLADRMSRADLSTVKEVRFNEKGEVITLSDRQDHEVRYRLMCGPTETFVADVLAPLKARGVLKVDSEGQPVNYAVSQAGQYSFVIFQDPTSNGVFRRVVSWAKAAGTRMSSNTSGFAYRQRGFSLDPKYLLLLATAISLGTTLFASSAVSVFFPVTTIILALWTVTLFFPQSLVARPVKILINTLRYDRIGSAQDLNSRAENALAPARGVERVGSALEEKLSIMYGLEKMNVADYRQALEIKDQALKQIQRRLERGEIDPSVRIRTSMSQPVVDPVDRKIKVGVYPIAGNPPHWSHLLAPLVAMAEQGLDKVYVLPQGFDRRKSDSMPIEELAERHEMNQRALTEIYGTWVEYAATGLGNSFDGEVNIRRISAMNPRQSMDLYYMVGADHYAFDTKGGNPDTLGKLFRPMKSVPVALENGSMSNLERVISDEFPSYNPRIVKHALKVIFIERIERIPRDGGLIEEKNVSMEEAEKKFSSADKQALKDQAGSIFRMAPLLNVSSSGIRNGDQGSLPYMVVSYLLQAPQMLRERVGIELDEIKKMLNWEGMVFPRGPPDLIKRAKSAASQKRGVARVGSALEEKLSAMYVAGHMNEGEFRRALEIKDQALDHILRRLENGEIDPSVRIKTSRTQPSLEPLDRRIKVGIYPIAGNPPHWSHLLAPLVAMAEQGLDKVYVLPQGYDRRKEKSMPRDELASRHELNQRVLTELYGTWVEYAATGLSNSYDGETNIRRIAAMNPEQELDLYYMVGADHFAFDTASGAPDTLGKLFRPTDEVTVTLEEGNKKTIKEIVAYDFPGYDPQSNKHSLKVIFIERIEREVLDDGTVLEKNISMAEAEKKFSETDKQALANSKGSIFRMAPILNVSSSEIRNGGKGALPFGVVEYLRQSAQALRDRFHVSKEDIDDILSQVNQVKTQPRNKVKQKGFFEIAVLMTLALLAGLLVIVVGLYFLAPDILLKLTSAAMSFWGLFSLSTSGDSRDALTADRSMTAYFGARTEELPLLLDGARSPSESLTVTLNQLPVREGEHLLAVFPGNGRTFVAGDNGHFFTPAPLAQREILLLLNSAEQMKLIGENINTRDEALRILGRTESEQRELEMSVLTGLAFDSGALTSNVSGGKKSFGTPWVEVTGVTGNIQVLGKQIPSNTPGGVAVAPGVEFVNVKQDLTRAILGNLGTLVEASREVNDASASFINPRLNLDLSVERDSILAKFIVNGQSVQSFDKEMDQDAMRLLTMAKYYSDLGEFERALAGSHELVARRLAAQRAGNESVPRVMEALGYHLGLLTASGMNHHRLTRLYASALSELVQNDETIVHLIRSAPVFDAAFALGRKAEVYSSKDMSWLGHMGSHPNAQVSPVLYVTDENRSTVGDLVVRAAVGVRTAQKDGVVTIFLMSDNEADVAQAKGALVEAGQKDVEVHLVAATGEKGVLYPETIEKTEKLVFSDERFLGGLPALGFANAQQRVANGEWVFPVISEDENLDLSHVRNREAFFLARLIGSIALVIRSANVYKDIDSLRRALVAA